MKTELSVLIFLSAIILMVGIMSSTTLTSSEVDTVRTFQEYLRIDTSVQENLMVAVEFWREQASALGLEFVVHYPAGLPVCVLTLQGSRPDLPSIMLNSHMDVVIVEPEQWKYPPFSGYIDEAGYIYGRGSQDCKGLAIMQLETLRYFVTSGIKPLRTIHMTLIPDEETGSFRGMHPFIKTQDFANMNVGFVLDEGIPSSSDDFLFTYVDKRPWQIKFTVFGQSGHGATVNGETAVEKLSKLLNVMLSFRQQQQDVMAANNNSYDYGAYTNLNVNYLRGGKATNVVPSSMELIVDIRLATHVDPVDIGNMVISWMKQVNNSCKVEYIRQVNESLATRLDETNPYWGAIQDTLVQINKTYQTVVCPATSDMVPIRSLHIPALGFVPNVRTISLIHGSGENIHTDILLQGVKYYRAIVNSVANVPPN